MRHIYNGEEGDFTDLTIAPSEPGNKAAAPGVLPAVGVPGGASAGALEASNLAALPPRCVFSCLTQNMCVGRVKAHSLKINKITVVDETWNSTTVILLLRAVYS